MIDLTKAPPVTGTVSLKKNDVALIKGAKTVKATTLWKSGTDYDVLALVLKTDGTSTYVAMFTANHGQEPVRERYNGVVHQGDITAADAKRSNEATETLEIVMDDSILAVVPVVYSARNNGTGSFFRYKVTCAVDDGKGTRVEVPADSANNDDQVYTCVPAVIYNTPEGVVVERVELYSKRRSENRPTVGLDRDGNVIVTMDKGPENDVKPN